MMRFIMPYLFRYVLKTFVQKQMRKAQQYTYQGQPQQPFGQAQQSYGQQQQQSQSYHTSTGKVRVEYVPEEQRQHKDFPGGEYVDYEEVK